MLDYAERDRIALKIIGDPEEFNRQMDEGLVDAQTVRRLIREGIEMATK